MAQMVDYIERKHRRARRRKIIVIASYLLMALALIATGLLWRESGKPQEAAKPIAVEQSQSRVGPSGAMGDMQRRHEMSQRGEY